MQIRANMCYFCVQINSCKFTVNEMRIYSKRKIKTHSMNCCLMNPTKMEHNALRFVRLWLFLWRHFTQRRRMFGHPCCFFFQYYIIPKWFCHCDLKNIFVSKIWSIYLRSNLLCRWNRETNEMWVVFAIFAKQFNWNTFVMEAKVPCNCKIHRSSFTQN